MSGDETLSVLAALSESELAVMVEIQKSMDEMGATITGPATDDESLGHVKRLMDMHGGADVMFFIKIASAQWAAAYPFEDVNPAIELFERAHKEWSVDKEEPADKEEPVDK